MKPIILRVKGLNNGLSRSISLYLIQGGLK